MIAWKSHPDCKKCGGKGYFQLGKSHWIPGEGYTNQCQCESCLLLLKDKDAIRRRLRKIMDDVESEMRFMTREMGWSFARTKRLPEPARNWVEEFATTDPLAIEYRRLLCQLWE